MTIEPLGVTVRYAAGVVVVELTGELDVATVPLLSASLDRVSGATVVVDLHGLSFMDSSGISALVHARKRLVGQRHGLVLTRPNAQVDRVLGIVGLAGWLEEWNPAWSA